ncbi:MAG: adenine phosphoribosyltransferase [Pseudomonadota bacterium]
MNLKDHIRTIPDFPKPGIMFRDVTTLFAHPDGFRETISRLVEIARVGRPDHIAGYDARGFVLAGAIAEKLGLGVTLLRKKGKLPGDTIFEEYELEYGTAALEIHSDAVGPGQRVFLVDDLIATGGTGLAGVNLIRRLNAEVTGFAAVIDLPELGGADRIRSAGVEVEALVAFEGH